MNFSGFLNQLLTNPSEKTIITINGIKHQLSGITKLSSLNYRLNMGFYYKAFFTNHSSLIIIPTLEQIQFSEEGDLGAIDGIRDIDIGQKEIVEYKGQKYKLDNSNDYQYTLELLFGKFEDVEGECSFSDYVNIDNPDDCLSLGVISKNGQRADVHSVTVDVNSLFISST